MITNYLIGIAIGCGLAFVAYQSIPRLLQVDETLVKSVPTAVLYFPRSKLVKNGCYSTTPL